MSRSGGLVSATITAVGLAAIGIGCFLPWVRSGSVLRDSFQVSGVIDRLLIRDNALLDAAFTGWIAMPALCLVCVCGLLVGLRRSAATVTIVVSVVAGTVGAATYVLGNNEAGGVSAVAAGPLTTAAGSAVALAGALGVILGSGNRRAGRRVRPYQAGEKGVLR